MTFADGGAPPRAREGGSERLVLRHLRLGWWSLLLFLTLGLVLESLHGFKVQWYVGTAAEIRRVMWRLAHAHGTLLALVHIAWALTLRALPRHDSGSTHWASRCLIAAWLCLPLGFFLGGLGIRAGDPGPGVLLVPPGGAALFAGVLLAARALRSGGGD